MKTKYQQAREDLKYIAGTTFFDYGGVPMSEATYFKKHFKKLDDFITTCEATEKAYEELKRDVKRFNYLFFIKNDLTIEEDKECSGLYRRLKNVGEEE